MTIRIITPAALKIAEDEADLAISDHIDCLDYEMTAPDLEKSIKEMRHYVTKHRALQARAHLGDPDDFKVEEYKLTRFVNNIRWPEHGSTTWDWKIPDSASIVDAKFIDDNGEITVTVKIPKWIKEELSRVTFHLIFDDEDKRRTNNKELICPMGVDGISKKSCSLFLELKGDRVHWTP